jgi:protein TonB
MVAIVAVALFHAVIGYAFITGLAYNVVKKVAEDLKTFDVAEEPPPPPEQPPPPPPEQKFEPPPMVAPPPIVQSPVIVQTPIQTVREAPPVIHVEAPPAPKPSMASPAKPRGNPGGWVTNDDYPSSAIREGVQGTTSFRLDIGPDGRATNCTVTGSSGSASLDDTACRLLVRRARFTPAKDAAGNGLASSYSNRVRWQIPE